MHIRCCTKVFSILYSHCNYLQILLAFTDIYWLAVPPMLPFLFPWKCGLLTTSAACIPMHSRLLLPWKQTLWTLIRLLVRSSLIWVHIVCNIENHRNISIWERRQQLTWLAGKVLSISMCRWNRLTGLDGDFHLISLRHSSFLCFDALHHSQQFFSHAKTISCLPGLNQYLVVDKVSCLKDTTHRRRWQRVSS